MEKDSSIISMLRNAIRLQKQVHIRYKAADGSLIASFMSPKYIKRHNGDYYVTMYRDFHNEDFNNLRVYFTLWIDEIIELKIVSKKNDLHPQISKSHLAHVST
ncbi:MAG: hypothetical protein ACFFCZ_30680 [Promethearchaeota archaeon]